MHFISRKFFLFLLILAGSVSWSLTMVKSGLVYSFGMGFWGPNGHDGVWHIALINHLARGSLEMPIFAGEGLKNYHIGFDLLLAGLHTLTRIPVHTLYFQIVPPLLALGIGALSYKFVFLWRKSHLQAFWATFFVYFAGDFGWVLTLFRDGKFGGESLFWAQQAVSTLINPPFATSLVLILLGLIFFLKLLQKFNIYYLVFTILFFGLLAQIKVYAAVLAFGALGMVLVYSLLGERKITQKIISVFMVLIVSAIFSLLLFLPLNSGSQGLIIFQPFWFLETMMAVSDRVGWERFYGALMSYKTGNIWLKLIPAYLVAFLVFFIGNMGTRVIGLWGMVRNKVRKRFSEVDVFLLTIALLGIVAPMIVLQAGTPWNTIQFFYYSLFVFSIYAGIWVGQIIEDYNRKPKYNRLIYYTKIGLIIALTIPTTVSTLLNNYLPARPPAKISNEELAALSFLAAQPQGIVLTYAFDRYRAEGVVNSPPRPLYLYESTAYVAAFSKHPAYFEDEVNLDITRYDWRARRKKVEDFFNSLDREETGRFLKENKIKYLYLVLSQSPVPGQRARLGEAQLGIDNIFENKEVAIYKVNWVSDTMEDNLY